MEKNIDIIFLEKEIEKVDIKFILIDSENQHNLICDFYDDNEIIFSDLAFPIGTQPFTLTQEEIDGINIKQ